MANLTADGVSTGYGILKHFLKCEMIVKHRRAILSFPWYGRLVHRLLVGWRCPACKAYAAGEHKAWGFENE